MANSIIMKMALCGALALGLAVSQRIYILRLDELG